MISQKQTVLANLGFKYYSQVTFAASLVTLHADALSSLCCHVFIKCIDVKNAAGCWVMMNASQKAQYSIQNKITSAFIYNKQTNDVFGVSKAHTKYQPK